MSTVAPTLTAADITAVTVLCTAAAQALEALSAATEGTPPALALKPLDATQLLNMKRLWKFVERQMPTVGLKETLEGLEDVQMFAEPLKKALCRCQLWKEFTGNLDAIMCLLEINIKGKKPAKAPMISSSRRAELVTPIDLAELGKLRANMKQMKQKQEALQLPLKGRRDRAKEQARKEEAAKLDSDIKALEEKIARFHAALVDEVPAERGRMQRSMRQPASATVSRAPQTTASAPAAATTAVAPSTSASATPQATPHAATAAAADAATAAAADAATAAAADAATAGAAPAWRSINSGRRVCDVVENGKVCNEVIEGDNIQKRFSQHTRYYHKEKYVCTIDDCRYSTPFFKPQIVTHLMNKKGHAYTEAEADAHYKRCKDMRNGHARVNLVVNDGGVVNFNFN